MTGASNHRITPPTTQELETAVARFQAEWGMVDEVLYRLCRDFPRHDSRSAVIAKVAFVERAYAAGLERQVKLKEGQQAVVVAGDFVKDHGEEVDDLIAALATVHEPLDACGVTVIVERHGCFTSLLREVTRGKALSPRSFASKYLHFHCPAVPIYDEYVTRTITSLVPWDRGSIPLPLPDHGDLDYWKYCVRFLRLLDACHEVETMATVKSLDAYLWAVPVAGNKRRPPRQSEN